MNNKQSSGLLIAILLLLPGIIITLSSQMHFVNFLSGFLLALVISFLSFYHNSLTKSGATASTIIGSYIFGFGGLKWAVPLLAFFIFSSLLSHLRKYKNENVDLYFEKSGNRDAIQVIANGGLGVLLVIIYAFTKEELLYYMFVSSVAAVCADTWSTEIGTLKKTKTLNLLNFKQVQQGRSGGVSFPGITGAFLGAILIGAASFMWIGFDHFNYLIFIIFAGVAGSLFDSFLGASLQLQYKCVVCKKITERKSHCSTKSDYFRGLKFINNDFVNFTSAVFGGIVGLTLIDLTN